MITDYRKKENDYEVIFNKEFPNRVSNALKDFLITCKQEDKEVEDIIKSTALMKMETLKTCTIFCKNLTNVI